MARTRTEKVSTKKKKACHQTAGIGVVHSDMANALKKYGQAENTAKAYAGHLQRGRDFCLKYAEECHRAGDKNPDGQPVDYALMKMAFTGSPNKYSSHILELYLAQCCFVNAQSLSTAEGIHGAFAKYWDKLEGNGKYAGAYKLNDITGEVSGCPARSLSVKDVMKAIKNKANKKGASATRNHAEAMTLDDLTQMMKWSVSQCPDERFGSEYTPETTSDLVLMLEHSTFRAFASLAFVIWTRNNEACGLQRRDITWGLKGPAPWHAPMWSLHLENRKGWQKQITKQNDSVIANSNHYHIYKQDIYALDLFTHVPRHIAFIEQRIGHPLLDDEYIFPYYSPNGVVDPKRSLTLDLVQSLIDKFAAGAGVDKVYTTHSFRRGGAQFRFMYAPFGSRWSLNKVRWWGGWAVGENVDTLIKYLVDSLQSLESGHHDSLHPIQVDTSNGFVGEDVLVQPATKAEVREVAAAVNRKVDEALTSVIDTVKSLLNSPPHVVYSQTQPLEIQNRNITLFRPGGTSAGPPASSPTPIPPLPATTPAGNPGRASSSQSAPVPIAGVVIPDLGHEPGAWRRAVTQWDESNPETGWVALKDWPEAWYTGTMRTKTGAKRGLRKLIAEEYINEFKRNDTDFVKQYPEANLSLKKLAAAIRNRHNRRRASKNGTPDERDAAGV
ncbi:hypothetical protein ONZ45_g3117 [Pleurotus djamor]|nr:hypothetical protein ONZ45_g3117 [Pleurotus djamor]